MGKSIGLKQLAEKLYSLIQGLPPEMVASFGRMEDAFDAIFYGDSGNGKTNLVIQFLAELIVALDCKAEYVSYEEGHGMTMQTAMIERHNLLDKIGNRLVLTDHLTYEELKAKMGKKQSAKIWIIDSVQASGLTYAQIKELKRLYVLGRKKKILIYISWADGKKPQGSVARDCEYYANIKVRVHLYVAFIKSRFGGNLPYISWEKGAKENRTPEDWDNLIRRIKGLPPKKKTAKAATPKKKPPTKRKEEEPEDVEAEEIEVE
ncbi:hypothetical protein ACTJIJ_22860 [Niabella sp. 22666]|uniref:hypothetical protein n=1 Tax=Niabella sp. 22666 TaxID=3453954 RepID=UPI003F87D719